MSYRIERIGKSCMARKYRFSLLDKIPVREVLADCDYKNAKELNYKQLKISWD